MSASSASRSTPEGPGSVAGGAEPPRGFTDTFTSRHIDTGGLRQHAVIGGAGPPLLLVHGWPENWYAWRMVIPGAGHWVAEQAPERYTTPCRLRPPRPRRLAE